MIHSSSKLFEYKSEAYRSRFEAVCSGSVSCFFVLWEGFQLRSTLFLWQWRQAHCLGSRLGRHGAAWRTAFAWKRSRHSNQATHTDWYPKSKEVLVLHAVGGKE
eukprot:jgi/Botrbrau1/4062/Bobra.152_3s0018.1